MVSEGFQWFQMVSERLDFSIFLDSSGPTTKESLLVPQELILVAQESILVAQESILVPQESAPMSLVVGPDKFKKSKNRNVRKPSETIGNLWKPLETLRTPSESLRNPGKASETFENLQKRVETTHFWVEMGQILVTGALDRAG